jgi:hypothetical protein
VKAVVKLKVLDQAGNRMCPELSDGNYVWSCYRRKKKHRKHKFDIDPVSWGALYVVVKT